MKENLELINTETLKQLKNQRQLQNIYGDIDTCFGISIYNACPLLFKHKLMNLSDFMKGLGDNLLPLTIVKKLNKKYFHLLGQDVALFRKYDFSKESYNEIIEHSIDNGLPIVLVVGYTEEYYKQIKQQGHAVTILGYDEEFYYIFENSEKNPIFTNICIEDCSRIIENPNKYSTIYPKEIIEPLKSWRTCSTDEKVKLLSNTITKLAKYFNKEYSYKGCLKLKKNLLKEIFADNIFLIKINPKVVKYANKILNHKIDYEDNDSLNKIEFSELPETEQFTYFAKSLVNKSKHTDYMLWLINDKFFNKKYTLDELYKMLEE